MLGSEGMEEVYLVLDIPDKDFHSLRRRIGLSSPFPMDQGEFNLEFVRNGRHSVLLQQRMDVTAGRSSPFCTTRIRADNDRISPSWDLSFDIRDH